MSTIQTTEMTPEEWISAHPEVSAHAPTWATEIDASDDGPQVAISYDRTEGSVEIGSAASWQDGQVRQNDRGVYVYFRENEALVTAEDLRRFASDFAAAADALESSSRTVRPSAHVDAELQAGEN